MLFYKTEVQIQCQKERKIKPCTILNIVHKSRCNLHSDMDGKLKRCKRSSYRSSHNLAQIRSANFWTSSICYLCLCL